MRKTPPAAFRRHHALTVAALLLIMSNINCGGTPALADKYEALIEGLQQVSQDHVLRQLRLQPHSRTNPQ